MKRNRQTQPARLYSPRDDVAETVEFAHKRDKRRKANKQARLARKKNRK
jgi:hypothetical protein